MVDRQKRYCAALMGGPLNVRGTEGAAGAGAGVGADTGAGVGAGAGAGALP